MRLDGKVVIVTGAANGIGAAAARRFAAEGARLILVDRDEPTLAALTAEIGPRAFALAADVAQDTTARAYVAQSAARFGRVDAALLNAGIEGEIGTIADLPVDAFDRVMAVNVRSVWLGLAALMPAMRDRGGSIVITSSTSGLRGSAQLAPYVASKHAVIGLMRSAAQEGAPHRIRVNTINPGPTRTRMIDAIDERLAPGAAKSARVRRIPLNRYAEIEEIVALMLFLASDESSFCTGATYLADGGLLSGASG